MKRKVTEPRRMNWLTLSTACLLAASMTSCVSQRAAQTNRNSSFANRSPVRAKAQTVQTDRSPARVAARPVPVLGKPNDLGDEFAHPSSAIRQAFSWGYFGNEWRVQMDASGYAHAGFAFRRPQNFSGSHAHCALTFKMKPAYLADRMAIAIKSEGDNQALILTRRPLSAYVTKNDNSWAYLKVNFTEFLDNSITVDGEGLPIPASATDFTKISEMRLVKLTGVAPQEKIIIRNLEIRQDLWAMQQ